jgi:hypothetical protein
MNFILTPQCNHRWGAPVGHDPKDAVIETLPVFQTPVQMGEKVVDCQISFWQPTPEEREKILAGEPIQLWIYGRSHPVVAMAVGAKVEW